MEASHFERLHPVDLSLTQEQYLFIQHFLPKKYALIEHKNIKKGVVVTSAVKLGPEDVRTHPCRPRISPDYPEMLRTPNKSKVAPNEFPSKKSINTLNKNLKN